VEVRKFVPPTVLFLFKSTPLTFITPELKKYSLSDSRSQSAGSVGSDSIQVRHDSDGSVAECVAMRMDIQIYEMERGVYLVDFKCDGYETARGRLLEDKEVTSPFPFLDMAARLIMQLADAD
jgi:carbon catabolite-derepressing protein kinase